MEKKTAKEMESHKGLYGFLLLCRKDGQPGTSYAFTNGKTTIGSSKDADIRLKITDETLEEIHCIIDVNDNGIATLLNKSELAPVKVNGIPIRKFTVLNHEDKIELVGKKFGYLNENITKEDVANHQTYVCQALLTPLKKRQSVAPIIHMSANKSPTFKTKTSIQKRKSVRRSFAGEFTVSLTPNKKPDRRSLTEAPKTTSKIIVSKALGSPCSPNKRRLSFGDHPKKFRGSPKVSVRNILISENIVSSTISEEDEVDSPKPSVSMKKEGKMPDFAGSVLDETNVSVKEIEDFLQSRRSTKNTPMKTPSTTSVKIVITEATPIQPDTPNPKTPVNKRLASVRGTPLSVKKSPLYKSSPRISKSAKKTPKKSVNLINFEDSDPDLETSGRNLPKTPASGKSTLNLSTKKSTKTPSINNSSKILDKSDAIQTPARISLRRNCSSIYRRDNNSMISSPLEKSKLATPKNANNSTRQSSFTPRALLNTPRNISTPKPRSSSAKNTTTSEDLSAGDSILLNLSSGSSVSPIKSLPRKSLASTDSDIGANAALEESKVRKSLRKDKSSGQVKNSLQKSQSSGIDVESSTDSFHLSLSDSESLNYDENAVNLMEDQSSSKECSKKTSTSLRKSHVEDDETQEMADPTKQRVSAASRRSSRRNADSRIEFVEDSEQSIEESADKSTRKSRQSLRNNLRSEEFSNEESDNSNLVSLDESSVSKAEKQVETSFDRSLTKSKRMSRRRNALEIEDSEEDEVSSGIENLGAKSRSSLRKSEKQFDNEADVSPNLTTRVSILDKGKRSSLRKSNQANRSETEEMSENLDISSKTPNTSIRSIERRSTASVMQNESIKERSSRRSSRVNEDFVNVSLTKTPAESSSARTSLAKKDSETPKETRSSLRKSNVSSEVGEISTDSSFENISITKTPKETPNQRRTISRNSREIRVSSSNEQVTYSFKNRSSVEEINIAKETLEESVYSSEDDSVFETNISSSRYTPVLRHTAVRKSHLTSEDLYKEETSNVETSSSRKSAVSRKSSLKTPMAELRQNASVITLDDSIDGTPENNTSIVIINTPFEISQEPHKKRSKIFRYGVKEDEELTTPKSVIKSRRPKSLPYNPLTEDITPVTPLGKSPSESGFKTPLNTPGLFENIKKSVLKSRSRSKKSSGLMEELNKLESVKKALKRQRESSESSARSSKKRKLRDSRNNTASTFESFDSFETEDVLTDISDTSDISYDTPKHFSDLTDKPVINHPQTRGSRTDPRPTSQKAAPPRRSLQATRRSSRISSSSDLIPSNFTSDNSDEVFESNADSSSSRKSSNSSAIQSSSRQENDPPSRKVQKSPKNDLSDVAGLKKLLKTPKEIKTPKNDLTDVRGVRKLLQTPRTIATPKNDLTQVPNLRRLMSPKDNKSPKNDLTDIIGVKKLLSTPKVPNSPMNDLSHPPNLRKLMFPKTQNSPRNDLTNIAGVRRLLGSPKEVKSPKNDLSSIPNLRNLMSPKRQNSPKNDLTNIVGVKKLLSTPKLQNSPKNDLRNVPNLRKIMSPKHQNSPKNDLSDVRGIKRLLKSPRQAREPLNDLGDVSGVADIFNVSAPQTFNESDAENNEDLFDRIFSKKPLRTYRGRSVSPETLRTTLFDNKRKTLGDLPYTSPRVEKWLSEQSNIYYQTSNQETNKEKLEEANTIKKKTRGRKIVQEHTDSPKESPRGRRRRAVEAEVKPKEDTEEQIVEDKNKKVTRTRRKVEEKVDEMAKNTTEIEKSAEEIEADNKISETKVDESEVHSTSVEVDFKVPPKRRGRQRKDSQKENKTSQLTEPDSTTEEIKPKPRGGRGKTAVDKGERDEESTDTETSTERPRRGRGKKVQVIVEKEEKAASEVTEKKPVKGRVPPRRGRTRQVADEEDLESIPSGNEERTTATRGTRRNVKHEESVDINESKETSVQEPDNNAKSKGTRGRRRNVKNEEAEMNIDDSKIKEQDVVASTPTRTARTRRLASNSDLEIVVSEEKPKASKKTGRRNKDATEEEEPEVKKNVPKSRTRKAVEEEEAKEESESSEVVETVGKSKRTVKNKVEKVEPVKATRSRRQAVTKDTNTVEESIEETEPVQKPVTVKISRSRKKKEETLDVDEAESVKSTRSKKQTASKTENESVDNETVEKGKRGRKKTEVDQEDVELDKTVKKGRKPSAKKAATTEETEDTPIKKRTRANLTEDELAFIESPRGTRAKRGHFNRYGSEFVTEKTDVEEVKHVRFEDAAEDKKRRGKNVEKLEVEETNRRSKRTRK